MVLSRMMTSHQIVCAGPSLAASLKPMAHHRNVASVSFFNSYYFGRCLSELAELFPPPHSCAVPLVIVTGCIFFLLRFLDRCYEDVFVKSFFPHTARLWNSVPAECFPLIYDLNGLKSRVNRHLFSMGFFSTAFLYDFHIFLNFLVTPSLVVAVQPCMEGNLV